jgi:hypothetical protein
VRPTLQASATSRAETDSARLSARDGAPLMWVYSSREPVQAWTSRGRSAISTSGRSASTMALSRTREAGSSNGVERGDDERGRRRRDARCGLFAVCQSSASTAV